MKTALVTGATGGIGRAIGLALLRAGRQVAFNYGRDHARADALCRQLEDEGYAGRYRVIQADLSDPAGIETLVSGLDGAFSRLDELVLNAGTTNRGSLAALRMEDWERVLRMNLTVPLFLVQRCRERMEADGSILFVGSIMGEYPHTLSLSYGTSKAAVHYLTRALVKEFADRRVRVNCIAPGFAETDWQRSKPEEIRRSIEGKIALHRFAEPEEIARCAVSILENPYMNGSVVRIDGGYCYQ